MVENVASRLSIERNDFSLVAKNVLEDWGFEHKVYADKWMLKKDD